MLSGHEDVVRDVCTVSPELKLIASASDDMKVRVWNVETGECTRILEHEYKVKCVCPLSKPDEPATLIASGSDRGIVKIWDVETGECLKTFSHPGFSPQPVTRVCFVSDGFVAVSAYNFIYICNIETGETVKTLRGHTSGVFGLCLSSPGFLASGACDETVRIWSVETGECVRTFLPDPARLYNGSVLSVCSVSPELLAAAKSNGTVQIWNKETGELVKTIGDDVVADYVWALCSLGHGYIAYSYINGIMVAKALPGAEGGRRGNRSNRGSSRKERKDRKDRTRKGTHDRKTRHKRATRNRKRV